MPSGPGAPADTAQAWLTVLGDVAGAQWVLRTARMAFGTGQAGRAKRIREGDRLFLYTARSAFNNPTRDEAQLVGMATVVSPMATLTKPVSIGSREFAVGCQLRLELVLPLRAGIPFRTLVPRMRFIRRKDIWGAYMRSSLIRLGKADARLLQAALGRARRAMSLASLE